MSSYAYSVWWVDKKEGAVSLRGFLTRRECGGICTLYLTRVKKFSPAKAAKWAMQNGIVEVLSSNEEPWEDHPDVTLEDLQHIAGRELSPHECTYHRPADDTVIWVERVIDG